MLSVVQQYKSPLFWTLAVQSANKKSEIYDRYANNKQIEDEYWCTKEEYHNACECIYGILVFLGYFPWLLESAHEQSVTSNLFGELIDFPLPLYCTEVLKV